MNYEKSQEALSESCQLVKKIQGKLKVIHKQIKVSVNRDFSNLEQLDHDVRGIKIVASHMFMFGSIYPPLSKAWWIEGITTFKLQDELEPLPDFDQIMRKPYFLLAHKLFTNLSKKEITSMLALQHEIGCIQRRIAPKAHISVLTPLSINWWIEGAKSLGLEGIFIDKPPLDVSELTKQIRMKIDILKRETEKQKIANQYRAQDTGALTA